MWGFSREHKRTASLAPRGPAGGSKLAGARLARLISKIVKVARYLQIENKLRAILNFEMADGIPLVP